MSRRPANQLRRIPRSTNFRKKKCSVYLLAATKETTFKAHYAFELRLINLV
jgi:hypothetical protein